MNPKLLFLKRKGGLGEKENFFSQEKKLSFPPKKHHFTLYNEETSSGKEAVMVLVEPFRKRIRMGLPLRSGLVLPRVTA